jgi:pimeloyl-ACP methyl ester carboxylesterase
MITSKTSENTRILSIIPLTVPLLAALCLLISGCASGSRVLWEREVKRSWSSGFQPLDLPAPPFRLAGLLRGERNPELVVYLEGDGRAIVRGRPSLDPTPSLAQGLELALADPDPLVLYLARVGQFMPAYTGERYQVFWSEGRLAAEAVQAANAAIDEVKRRTGARWVHLIGYSGGGGLAVLLAGTREDVLSLVTVAGLLDIDWWVKHNGWRPLSLSLNPADFVQAVSRIPQIHIFGFKDSVIAPAMSQRFASMASFSDLTLLGLPNDHYSGWTPVWGEILKGRVLPLRRKASAVPGLENI